MLALRWVASLVLFHSAETAGSRRRVVPSAAATAASKDDEKGDRHERPDEKQGPDPDVDRICIYHVPNIVWRPFCSFEKVEFRQRGCCGQRCLGSGERSVGLRRSCDDGMTNLLPNKSN